MIPKALVLPALMLTMLSIFPSTLGTLKFVPIYKSLTIRANKRLPPHIAYMDSQFDIQNSEWLEFEKKSKQPLLSGVSMNGQQGPYVLTQLRALEGVTIRKSRELIVAASDSAYKTPIQMNQEKEGPQWLNNIVRQPSMLSAETRKIEVSLANLTATKRITGHVELKDGLAVTNEHHIEVRRSDEGIFREMGRVDLAKGLYSIDVDDASGIILARLIDKNGTTLGEGSIRISQLPSDGRLIYGPRLEIAPSPTWTGSVGSYYTNKNPKAAATSNPGGHVTSLGGENEIPVGKNGEINLNNITRGSSTVVRSEVPNHMPSNKIMMTGEDSFNVTNFPISMMSALKEIVTEPGVTYTKLEESTFVWGKVTIDGQPVSGVSVQSESDTEVKPIYFNDFMIPDSKLTSTGANGLYAFVNIQPGFNAILAQRGDAYFGHQNIVAEVGSVAIGDIQSTLRTDPVRVRAFDAFAGEPVRLIANLQSLGAPVELQDGSASVILPHVSRLSMIYTEVEPEFISANYFYNDKDAYIHLPILRKDWITELKATSKIDDISSTGTIVGFFGEENFEAYLAGASKDSGLQIVYFDAAGKVITSSKGQAGGGFVIFNVPIGTQETVVFGSESERIYSKVVPVDADTTSVLNFTSY